MVGQDRLAGIDHDLFAVSGRGERDDALGTDGLDAGIDGDVAARRALGVQNDRAVFRGLQSNAGGSAADRHVGRVRVEGDAFDCRRRGVGRHNFYISVVVDPHACLGPH